MTLLIYDAENPFKAVIIDSNRLPEETAEFHTRLQRSLSYWRQEMFRIVWLQIPTEKAHLIPIAISQGFTFHHCQPTYLTLTYPIVKDVTIPGYATHFIGVGGLVINDNRELLVIVEQHAYRDGQPERFKIPGGALYAGEHIADGVRREVLEETGIKTQFQDLTMLRHKHGYRYDRSDIYFVCRLIPTTHTIIKQVGEIYDARWMPVKEFLARETISGFHKGIVKFALNDSNNGSGLTPNWLEYYDADRSTREILTSNLFNAYQ